MIKTLQSHFVEEIYAHAQQTLDSFYTDGILLTTPANDVDVIGATQYLQPNNLLSILKASPEYQKTQDLRVAASLWNKAYSWTPLPGVLAFMTWAGVGFDASLDNVSFVFKDGELQALWFHDPSRTVIYPERCPISIPNGYPGKLANSVDELYNSVFTGLFQNHLLPIINRLHTLTKVSKKTLWGNAVNASYGIFEDLDGYAKKEAIQTDYSVLFEQPHSLVLSNSVQETLQKPNPLYNLIRSEKFNEPGLPTQMKVRKTCCLIALIPPDYSKCGNCPLLKPSDRIARMKKKLAQAH
ncbi:ferric iron reductase [Chlorogloeopsis sp. ULAP01]|uniref:ferric iron reductase n=1 Tax=Chlorogloeopsis sp. ULAP01 TaxID=3056483 RepID=UPI0025AB1135|nr:ferric iron reductase [Chlorogloeopsis sp. ULAP01]MDM9385275.1 ferric iron reductase [Chlorogloeopsis sp. ULAP01]